MTYFTYSRCYTCQYKKNRGTNSHLGGRQDGQDDQRKIWVAKDSKDTTDQNEIQESESEEVKSFLKKLDHNSTHRDITDEDLHNGMNDFSIVHSCNDPKTFSFLITFNQRLAFTHEVLDKSHPGYQKPTITLKHKFTLEQLISQFTKFEDDDAYSARKPIKEPQTIAQSRQYLGKKPLSSNIDQDEESGSKPEKEQCTNDYPKRFVFPNSPRPKSPQQSMTFT